ncbi:glycosyl transferase [Agaricicola taiwanensis]|uniref:Glycosyl transferase n=1 Tax=Agaricicola taiwanensis TaxID=591372 RepID=A0A8J2VMC3_9RHOB|nr:glycosyltransferase family 1 protein [Agaricicola taiwanensis]GGE28562.1 glycosyl transferase [Agaricicola taiwanensis]
MRVTDDTNSLGRPSADVLICFSHLRWNFVYQRPQHLLSRAARQQTVYFVEEPIFEEGADPHLAVERTPENVTVAVPVLPAGMNGPQITRLQRGLIDELLADIGNADRITLWYYTPMALPFSRHLNADLCVYDNMDELSAFRGAHPRLIAMERELFRRAQVIFTGGQSLFEAKRRRHHNVHAFPSSIDATHFGRARQDDVPVLADQDGIEGPRLGFFGVIDERMDIDLVGRIAELRPDWQFMMIGPVVKIDPASLPQRANLHWLGSKRYEELPAYLAGWDVGIMPFALNESTRFISPTKTPEFLAAGVPVVSTAITDVIRPYGQDGLVEIAADPQEFVAKAEHLLARPKDGWLKRVDAHLAGMSWDLTWQGMAQEMEKAAVRPRVERKRVQLQEAVHV